VLCHQARCSLVAGINYGVGGLLSLSLGVFPLRLYAQMEVVEGAPLATSQS